ncbi:hypothetical protein [Burkholderia cepacia]|uniref:hypothetical protein n=2 Tax=Burkholderiaceae TaxID=119060 RepID=UPI0012D85609|nr:hypothetical protein [Burkholderia cepacia]
MLRAVDPDQISVNSRACEYPAKRSGARLYGMSGETAARGRRFHRVNGRRVKKMKVSICADYSFQQPGERENENGRPLRPPVS